MANQTSRKSSNKENKRNDMNRPVGLRNDKKNLPKYENYEGIPMQ